MRKYLIALAAIAALAVTAVVVVAAIDPAPVKQVFQQFDRLDYAALTLATLVRRGVDFVLPDGKATQLFTYTSNDDNAAIVAANYFNGAVDILPKGSIIDAIIDWDGTAAHKRYFVTSNNGTVVAVSAVY